MIQMIDAEVRRRNSGYVTYRCMDVTQKYVKFSTVPPVIEPPPPTAATQVYTCADAGADGRILESATVQWPNCQSTSYKAPSRSLVVATNDGAQPLYWRLASKVTDSRIWTQTGTQGAWVRATSINWGTTSTPGSVTLSWTQSTETCSGAKDFAKYRILYGTSPSALDRSVDVLPEVREHVFHGLSPGTWYFAVKAVDVAGGDCGLSPISSKVIP
jgi:hypothetical protein